MRQLFGEWRLFLGEIIFFCRASRFAFSKICRFLGKIGVCERDSSGTTRDQRERVMERIARREADKRTSGARQSAEAARPNSFVGLAAKIFIKKIKLFLIIN